jgi:cell wall-associated NlpC family hydrolase
MRNIWVVLALLVLPFAARAEETVMSKAGIVPQQSLSATLTPDASEPTPQRGWSAQAEELILRAVAMLGVNYRYGGNSPEKGFDCSGFVRHVFGDALGITLPRNVYEQSRTGAPIASAQLRPGDLVFFNTLRRSFSHVGIYLGNNRFIHAPRTGQSVRIAKLNQSYWAQRFNGARRVLAAAN